MVLTMPPFSPAGILCFFLVRGKYCVLHLEHGKLERLRRTSNALEGEACLIIKCVSGAHALMCLRRMMF